jgi:LPXTG-motif cell wall-anchored protein
MPLETTSMTSVRRRLSLVAMAGGALVVLLPGPASATLATTNPTGNAYHEYLVTMANGPSGEPSIGWVPAQKAAMYGANVGVSKLTWDDSKPGSPMTGTDVTPTGGSLNTLDTIVTVDPAINRTFFAELAGAGSTMWYSDDAGASWTPSTGVSAGVLLDHESVGAGPFAPTSIPHPLGTDAVYYCAQNSYNGACGTSYDGGISFAPGMPVDNTPVNDQGDPNSTFAAEGGACSALHGHLKVAPDGTAYLPLKGCGGAATGSNLTNTEFEGGMPSVSVSTDDGQSWTIRMDPFGSNTDESDNAVAIGAGNTLYMTWEDGKNISDSESAHTTAAKVSISLDRGQTWLRTTDLDPPGIHNVMFPVVTAGDDGRAAVAFLGTSGIGDDQQNGFVGSWDLYVSTTYDQGVTWSTVDATAGDPVHRGCIDNQGIAPGSPKNNVCNNRNLLDFNDITVDSAGRVLVAYTKTCTSKQCIAAAPNSDSASLSIDTQNYVLRQSAGKGLLAAFDGTLSGVNAATTTPQPSGGTTAVGAHPTLPNTSAAWSSATAASGAAIVLIGAVGLVRRRRRGERAG